MLLVLDGLRALLIRVYTKFDSSGEYHISEGTQAAKGAGCKPVTLDTPVVRIHPLRPYMVYSFIG